MTSSRSTPAGLPGTRTITPFLRFSFSARRTGIASGDTEARLSSGSGACGLGLAAPGIRGRDQRVKQRLGASATASTASLNTASLAFDGLRNPASFLTNWSDASRISSSVAGGSKLNKVLMFRHIASSPESDSPPDRMNPERRFGLLRLSVGARLALAAPVETSAGPSLLGPPLPGCGAAPGISGPRGPMSGSSLSQELRKPVPRFRGPVLHAGLEHPIAVFDRLEARRDRHLRLPASFFEGCRVDDDVAGHPFELEGADQALGPLDLAIRAVERKLGAVRPARDVPPDASGPDVHLVNRGRISPRPPPERDQFRVRVHLEHPRARRVERAFHDDLPIRRQRERVGLLVVRSSAFPL